MLVENEVLIHALLVLTDTGFNQRSPAHCGKTALHVGAGHCQAFIADTAVTVSGVEFRATYVGGDLESMPLVRRNSIKGVTAAIDLGRYLFVGESPITRSNAEVKDLLPGGTYLAG